MLDCADDSLGACIQKGYYFRPDASLERMKAVKKNRQKILNRGVLVFEYPKWWQ